MMDNWIIFIGAGRWQLVGFKRAKELGLKIIAVDGNSKADGFKLADEVICVDISHAESAWDIIKGKIVNKNIVSCLSICSDVGMRLVGLINQSLKLNGPDLKLCEKLTNKQLQREVWANSDVASPKFIVVSHSSDFSLELSFPLIVKPIDSAGSRGVTKVDSMSELTVAIDNALCFSQLKRVIIEEFIVGNEYAVESIFINGKCNILSISLKEKISSTKGTVANAYLNKPLDEKVLSFIKYQIENAYKSLGYLNGIGHAEIIVDDRGNGGLVEVAGRGGGFGVFESYIHFLSGVDLPMLAIKQSLGSAISIVNPQKQYGTLEFFQSSKGIVRDIVLGEAMSQDSNVSFESFVKIGQKVGDVKSDGDRLGSLMTRGLNFEELLLKHRKVFNDIRFEMEQ